MTNIYLIITLALMTACSQAADKQPSATKATAAVSSKTAPKTSDTTAPKTSDTSADSTEIEMLLSKGYTSVLDFANHFLGRPYVAHTLEVNDEEQLVVNTRELDCTTLVETVTALTLCARQGQRSFADYCHMLQLLRYRGGKLDRYPSRLHYFSDWIIDKEKMGITHELQPANGQEAKEADKRQQAGTAQEAPLQEVFSGIQKLDINYMSRHASSYKALKNHPAFIPEIAAQEKALTGLTFRFIPKNKVNNTQQLRSVIHDGDIIAITCSKAGLDIAHLGFAVWKKDGLHLLNASQLHKKVVLEPMTLKTYLSKHPTHTGIRIIRINKHDRTDQHQ